MRADPSKINRVVPAEVVEGLAGVHAVKKAGTVQPVSFRQAPLVSARVFVALLRLYEGILIALLGSIIAVVYLGPGLASAVQVYIPVIAATSLAMPVVATLLRLYSIPILLRPTENIAKLAAGWTMIFAAITAGVFFSKAGDSFSRVWLTLWFASGIAVLVLSRIATAALVRHLNRNRQFDRNAVLVGGGQSAADLVSALAASPNSGISIAGIFDDRDDLRSPPELGEVRKLGNTGELIDFVRRNPIDMLLVVLPLTAEARLLQILKRLWILPVDIRLSAYSQKLHYRPRAYSYIGNVPFLDVFDKPLGDWGPLIKALEDKIIAALMIVLFAPVMALIALAVKLESKGPILFTQKRYGFNNELIEIYKFRSMHHEMADAEANKLVTRDDPRVTRVGRLIRKTSLDELPQFFNVLKGDLSLVGPRPHPTKAKAGNQLYNDVVDGYFARHKVKPGITGWAQINGWRGETDTAEKLQRRVEHDLYYIENWSLALDLYILFRTPFSIFNTEGAY